MSSLYYPYLILQDLDSMLIIKGTFVQFSLMGYPRLSAEIYSALLREGFNFCQSQTEASVLAEISFNFVFTHPPRESKKNQNCSKWHEMARKLVEHAFWFLAPPQKKSKLFKSRHIRH